MTKETLASVGEETSADRSTVIQPLIDMLDYAIIGGAELKLPKFVFLLRVASEELTNSLEDAIHEDDAGSKPAAGATGGDP